MDSVAETTDSSRPSGFMSSFRVEVATDAAPGHENEDYFAASGPVAVLLDGAGFPNLNSGCVHGVRWFVHQLGGQVLASAADLSKPLQTALRESIRAVARKHETTCDLANPNSPTATVIAVRALPHQRIDYLVLCDSTLLLFKGSPTHITDHRLAEVEHEIREKGINAPDQRAKALASQRNQPGGFWVAGPVEEAADHALIGEIPNQPVALLSDGATRTVDLFDQDSWESIAHLLQRDGPTGLIRRVRDLEQLDPSAVRWPRSKPHDDATAALVSPGVSSTC